MLGTDSYFAAALQALSWFPFFAYTPLFRCVWESVSHLTLRHPTPSETVAYSLSDLSYCTFCLDITT